MERILESYDAAYNMKFVALRYFNASGCTERKGEDHEPESHLIPNILFTALGKQPHITVHGNDYPTPDGTAIRDYIHVVDLADAHILALEHLRKGGSSDYFNLGTGTGFSVMHVVEAAREVTGREIPVKMGPRRAGDPPRLVAVSDKARRVLGWNPQLTDLKAILTSAWKWHQAHPEGYARA
jgi:UDP-glucose 4-epimerase